MPGLTKPALASERLSSMARGLRESARTGYTVSTLNLLALAEEVRKLETLVETLTKEVTDLKKEQRDEKA
jgi:hypothetical protein